MRAQAIIYIHEELSTIEALLSRTHGQTDDIKNLILQIEKSSIQFSSGKTYGRE
jgi:hypothetical protein